jgi:hypothetical protein
MRRSLSICVLALVSATAVASSAQAAPRPTAREISKPTALKINEIGGGRIRVDRGQLGASVGDTVVLSHNLKNRARQLSKGTGAGVGVSRGVCNVLVVGTRWLCRWVFVLPNGQVQMSGIVELGTKTAQVAVIGGTGAYNNTGGAAYRKPNGANTSWTLRLIP